MYRKIHCDWFLSDGIYPPIRLDSPMYVEDALVSSGVIRAELSYEEHLRAEWVYRRSWKYFTTFRLEGPSQRTFLRISGLKGSWRVLINSAEAARGEDSVIETEASASLKDENELEIIFDAPPASELRPVVGFGGMLSLRSVGSVAITNLQLTEDAGVFAAIDALNDCECELILSVSGRENSEKSLNEKLSAGYTPVLFDDTASLLAAGEVSEIELKAFVNGELSDARKLICCLPEAGLQPRGFVGDSEELMSLAENAGAISAFTLDAEPPVSHRLLAARHGLESLSAEGLTAYETPEALMPLDDILAICEDTDRLDRAELWLLTGSNYESFLNLKKRVPSEDLGKIVAYSRFEQAEKLRLAASEARLGGSCFMLDGVLAKPYAPLSRALCDRPGHMRPAYYALMGAWQSEYGYIKVISAENDIVSCEVYFVSDGETPPTDSLSVDIYDINGTKLLTNSFPALSQGRVGRFTFELPKDGCAIARTGLVKGEECQMSSDEIILSDRVSFEDMPLTQLLAAEGRVTNVGSAAALGVSVPGAGYFGCLLPGEYVSASRGDPDEAEGLNIFM